MSAAEKRQRTPAEERPVDCGNGNGRQATKMSQSVLKHQQKRQRPSVPVATATNREAAGPMDEAWFAEFVDPVSGTAVEPMDPAEFDRQYGIYQRLREVVSGMLDHFRQWRDETRESTFCASAAVLQTLQEECKEQGARVQRCIRALHNLHQRLSQVKLSMGP